MQAGAYDTVLILFYFSLSFCLSHSVCNLRATPFFATTPDVYTRYQFTGRLPTNQLDNNFYYTHLRLKNVLC